MKNFLILTAVVISLFGFAGGGGSDSGGGSSFDSGSSGYSNSWDDDYTSNNDSDGGILELVCVVAFFVVLVMLVIKEKSEKHNNLSVYGGINEIDQNNTEQEKWIHEEAERIFVAYQQDWSDYNLEKIQKYTTENYFKHASLMLDAINRAGRRNIVSNLIIARTILYTPVNNEVELPKTICLAFIFNGTDSVIDTKTKTPIYSENARDIMEYWNFIYDGKTLKLDGITQSTESAPHLIKSIAEFAKENDLFYSADWGRLALPSKGIIFEGYNVLRDSDVNNHVIGKWNECLVQIYTYSATPGNPDLYYIVGQINIPKAYDGVIVEAKNAKLKVRPPKKYEKFDTEWGEFNQYYNIFATSKDAIPVFELLNPKFMERLRERDLPYNIEVKDNTIYIFAKVTNANIKDYAELLNVLSDAFNELKM